MITRVLAWACVAALCWGVWSWSRSWRNPWSVPVSPITSVMPSLPNDCAKRGCF